MNKYGLYAEIKPGPTEREWTFRVYKTSYVGTNSLHDQLQSDTRVNTNGVGRTQTQAEKRATKRIAEMVKAYDLLARPESTVE